MRHFREMAALLATLVAVMVFAGAALAQDNPAGQGYGGQAGTPLGGVAGEQSGSAGVQSVGSLPFTGFDLALLVVGGMALAGVGAALVRAGTTK